MNFEEADPTLTCGLSKSDFDVFVERKNIP